jgi:demethylspheroidene O-methyltransferase
MAQSQALVAQDTLATVSLRGVTRLMDVGGGSGAFLAAALQRHPGLSARLVDLPAVLEGAEARLRPWCDAGRLQLCPQDFRAGPLPAGADAISLIRVLYDHPDAVVRPLLRRCFEALPPRGRLIISEPMSGGAARPDRATDLYFAFYTLAMGSGEARSQARIAALCAEAGFVGIRRPRVFRPYVTGVVTAMRGR